MVTCIFCNSSADIVKAGFRYNGSGKKQRYKCNNCKKRFVPNDGFWKMKHKPEIVVEACSCYKRGMSFKEVSNHFREYDKADICQATVYNWVKKYSKALKKFVSKQTPKIKGPIHLDEVFLKVKKT